MACFRVGDARVDFIARTIEREGESRSLEPKVMSVLKMLVERSGQVVSRDALVDAIWSVRFGGDERLSRAISLLRTAFGDSGGKQGVIRTIPKEGYSLLADVEPLNAATSPAYPASPETAVFLPAPPNSVAVLPFDDMSMQGDRRYLGDGIAEEIINGLAQIEGAHVTGRVSSFAVRDAGLDTVQISRKLGVAYVMEGSVRLQADKLRITAQLVSAQDGFHRWSREFNGEPSDLFAFYDEVAAEVVSAFADLTGLQVHTPAASGNSLTRDTGAYQLFLEGRNATHQQDGRHTLPKAIALLGEAVERDPEFAQAWAFLSIAHFFMLEYSSTPEWRHHLAEGRKAAEHAFRLSPHEPVTAVPRFFVAAHDVRFDRHCELAQTLFDRAPNSPMTHYYLAVVLIACGLMKEGLGHLDQVLRSEPLSIAGQSLVSTARFTLGETEQSEEPYLRAFDLGILPSGITAIWLMVERGEAAEAQTLLHARYHELAPLFANLFGVIANRFLIIEAVVHGKEWARTILASSMRRRMLKGLIQPNAGALIMPVILARPKLFMDACRNVSATYLPGALAQIWADTRNARLVREHDEFPQFVSEIGLVEVWKRRGWPDGIDPANFVI